MKNKKAMVEFIVTVVIAITALIFFAIVPGQAAYKAFFGNVDIEEFNKFVDVIDNLKEGEPKALHFPLIKESGALIFVSKIRVSGESDWNLAEDQKAIAIFSKGWTGYFPIPDECKEGKGCVCLCRENFIVGNPRNAFFPDLSLITCETAPICKVFKDVGFNPIPTYESLKIPIITRGWEVKEYQFTNGFFIKKISDEPDVKVPSTSSSIRIMYIENIRGTIDVCMGNECSSP